MRDLERCCGSYIYIIYLNFDLHDNQERATTHAARVTFHFTRALGDVLFVLFPSEIYTHTHLPLARTHFTLILKIYVFQPKLSNRSATFALVTTSDHNISTRERKCIIEYCIIHQRARKVYTARASEKSFNRLVKYSSLNMLK